MTEETLACSLNGPELIKRVEEWRRLTSQATSRRVEEAGIVSTYPREERVVQELRRLIAAEGECCSFMKFEVRERPDEVEVELRVPEGMTESLAQMLGLVTDPAGSAPRV